MNKNEQLAFLKLQQENIELKGAVLGYQLKQIKAQIEQIEAENKLPTDSTVHS